MAAGAQNERGVQGVVLVRSDDPTLRDEAVRALVREAVGTDDPAFAVVDLQGDDGTIGAAVDAASTPPMFSSRRIVILRDIGRFASAETEPLLDYLAAPVDTSVMVLVSGGGQIQRKLLDALRKASAIVDAGAPTGKARQGWLAERLADAPVRLDGRAAARLSEHLGEDLGRLSGIVAVLAAVYGVDARIGVDELEPFLGSAGAGAPWELTDAVDRGDVAGSLAQLHRALGAGDRHPLQVMATLQVHFGRLLRLDGSGATDEVAAAQMLGITGSTFPAKKALVQSRKLGRNGAQRAMQLLAQADLDLRGVREIPGDTVLEILVARLARLARA